MNSTISFYNDFYKALARIDAKNNTFEKIKNYLPMLSKGSRLLDIGCGFGNVSKDLIKKGIEVYGLEINKEAIRALKKKGFKVVSHDISEKLPFSGNYFDGILLLDILEHVFDPLGLLSESARVLKKGGFIIVSVPLYFDLIDRIRILFTGSIVSYDNRCYGDELFREFRSFNYDHIRFFHVNDIKEMIDKCGMAVERLDYIPMTGGYFSSFWSKVISLLANNYTVKLFPQLFAHGVKLRVIKK